MAMTSWAIAALAALAASITAAKAAVDTVSSEAVEEVLPGALLADDACDAAEGEGAGTVCGLALRQLRGESRLALEVPAPALPDEPRLSEEGNATGNATGSATGSATGNATGNNSVNRTVNSTRAKVPVYDPWDSQLLNGSDAPLHTFYMYRAVSDEVYPPMNINSGNLAGVLWYLHHEVVVQYPRKFDISRIFRYKVQTRATKPLFDLGMNFGVRFAFDSGECTGPFACGRQQQGAGMPEPVFCDEVNNSLIGLNGKPYEVAFEWAKYGYFVGCNNLGQFPFPMYPIQYPGATWYSLPGPCPSARFSDQTRACELSQPGGYCNQTPTGAGNCTWTYEEAGVVSLNEVVGIPESEWPHFRNLGKKEYDPFTDKGLRFSWWDGIHNETLNLQRINRTLEVFEQKYPNSTKESDMPEPPCDFTWGPFYREFYWRDPNSGPCAAPEAASVCAKAVQWAKSDGIYAHPEWYFGLDHTSTFHDFQKLFYMRGQSGCPRPCTDEDEDEDEDED